MDSLIGWTDSTDYFQAKLCASRAEEARDGCTFVADCPAMTRVRAQMEQAAGVDFPVLLLGETGVGKDAAARLIHKLSARAHGMFLKVNCAALPADLLERELFGYEATAFAQAAKPTPGKFELCDRGTILLDEIGELPSSIQAKLLQVLDNQQFSRPGSRSLVTVDVRILVATDAKVAQALATKRFREDLYDRLNVLSIHIPPLRERTTDIPFLFRHFLKKYNEKFQKATPDPSGHLLEAAQRYPWPGNLHELENFVKRYVVAKAPSGDDHESSCELVEMTAARRLWPTKEATPVHERGLTGLSGAGQVKQQ